MNTICGANLSAWEAMCDGNPQDIVELIFNHTVNLCAQ